MASKVRKEDDIHPTQTLKTDEDRDASEVQTGLKRALPISSDDHNTLFFKENMQDKSGIIKQSHIGRPRALHEEGEAELHRRILEAEKSGNPLTRSECLSNVRSY